MTSAVLERELRRRLSTTTDSLSTMTTTMALPTNKILISPAKSPVMLSPIKAAPSQKRRSSSQRSGDDAHQNNNNHKRRRHVHPHNHHHHHNGNMKEDMFQHYQPWVIQTYGDSAKTKTITLRKYARILRTLRGEESNSVENSKFRFWVKAKGFRIGQPPGYVAKPADGIIGSQSLSGKKDAKDDPSLYVPTSTSKDGLGREKQLFKKVAVVENFFDIIYSVHVEMEGRAGKHAGQKRTYRAITETYAFLPREAVTRFLLGCTDCQRRPRSPSPSPSPSPAPVGAPPPPPTPSLALHPSTPLTPLPARAKTPDPPPAAVSLKTTPTAASRRTRKSVSPPRASLKASGNHRLNNNHLKRLVDPPDIDFSLPITTTYLKHMRSLGYTDEDALKIDVEDNVSTPEPDASEDDHFPGAIKDAEKFRQMLLAWNNHAGRNGDLRLPDDRDITGDDVAGLWTGYHNALGLKKSTPPGPREQSSPLLLSDRSLTQETGSVHDETSSSGNKEDEDDDEDDGEDKIDPQQYDPERLKAFNMFVRLFVDENLDRIVPISKQPKEKIQAIIDSCTRQFPEFAERARKRIRTYLKSCRRNKRSRDSNGAWDAVRITRPTPAHLTSVQAEQILAQACENESHNAKRMRLGLEPVSQPLPLLPSSTEGRPSPLEHYTSPVANDNKINLTNSNNIKTEPLHSVDSGLSPNFSPTIKSTVASVEAMAKSINTTSAIATTMNGNATSSSAAPTAVYRPNFSQAFQRVAATGPYPTPLFPTPPFGTGGMISNGPTDLSMKTKPLLSHKLNTAEMAAVRQLITGYRESAAFLLRSADELEQLLLQQQ